MRLYSIFTLLLCLSLYGMANDCGSAATLTLGNNSTLSIDNFTDYSPVGQRPCSSTSPNGDAWFEFVPGGTNTTNYDVTFLITPSNAGNYNFAILYSESVDAGDPCQWDANTEGYTYYNSVCNKSMNGGTHTYFLRNRALDGSGHYFILIERIGGTGGSVTVKPSLQGTCTAPANDRCATPTVLTAGAGLDPNTSTSSPVSWTVSAPASTKCATKQRMNDPCQPGGADPTEDHYGNRTFFGQCYWSGNVGDVGTPPLRTSTCDEFLENTVWYSFQVPFNQSNWKIHFGSTSQCQQQPNNMVAMLLENVNCNDAKAADEIRCDKFPVFGAMPSPDLTWSNLTLNAGVTYHIVLDGTRNSQCDVNILVTRATINPVLPVSISTFEGTNKGKENRLYWETSYESDHDYFEVEVSRDNYTYQSLGTVAGIGNVAEGQINSYDFTDIRAPFGTAYYRLKSVDVDGRFVYSKTIEIFRQAAGLELDGIYPVPMKEQVKIRLGSADPGEVSIELMDLSGHIVRDMQFYMQPGSNEVTLEVANLPAGMYIFRIRHGFETIVKKVNKQ